MGSKILKILENPSRADLAQLLFLSLAGIVLGCIAWQLGMPLPFLMGGLLATMFFVAWQKDENAKVYFPRTARSFFVGVIGVLIGGTFSAEAIALIPELALSFFAMLIYVSVSHPVGAYICRRWGAYDKATAFYASMPGGLIESLALGERCGCDMRLMALTHFFRIFLVVTIVPWLILFAFGGVANGAADIKANPIESDLFDVGQILLMTLVGMLIGKRLKLPSSHLLGPLILSAIAHASGFLSAPSPMWLLFMAQLYIGIGLGGQFSGLNRDIFLRVLKVTPFMVAFYLSLSFAFSLAVASFTNMQLSAVFLSFSPGGVTEMGLIALSLSISPVIVAAHHTFRIFVTVLYAHYRSREFIRPD